MKYLKIILLILFTSPLVVFGQNKFKRGKESALEQKNTNDTTYSKKITAKQDNITELLREESLITKEENMQLVMVNCEKSESRAVSIPLVTIDGRIIGSYQPRGLNSEYEDGAKGNITINGNDFPVTSLSNAVISHNGLNVIVHGDLPNSHRGGSVLFEIYGVDGQPTGSLKRSCFVNCVGPATDLSGNIYIAGHLNDNNDGASLVCYGPDGVERWNTRISTIINPVSIHVSPLGKNVVVRGNGIDFSGVQVVIDGRSGLPLPFISDHFTFSSFEFIDDDHVILYNRLKWSVVDLNSSNKAVDTGQFDKDYGPSLSSIYLGASKQLMTLHLSSNTAILRLVGTQSRKTTFFELQGVSFSGKSISCYERSTGEVLIVVGSETCILQLP